MPACARLLDVVTATERSDGFALRGSRSAQRSAGFAVRGLRRLQRRAGFAAALPALAAFIVALSTTSTATGCAIAFAGACASDADCAPGFTCDAQAHVC